MNYIFFIATLQIPFLYFLWKVFQAYESRTNVKLRMLQKDLDNLEGLQNVMRMAHQKMRDDLNGEIVFLKSELTVAKNHIQQLERHTGIRQSSPVPTVEWSDVESVASKDFL